jgi:putative protease
MGGRMDNYPMSLKDNCLVNHLKELEEAGVKSVKIEGRMKRPEYSAVVTGIYYRAIRDNKEPTQDEMDQLVLAFSRQGFTDGYLTGKKGESMFGIREESDKEANKLFTEVRKGYTGVEMRRVPVKFYAMINKGEPAKIAVEDDKGNKIITAGPVPEAAQTQALTEQAISEQLYKTGGTPYTCSSVGSIVEPELFLSAAAINEMRRKLLADLSEKRKEFP